MPSKNAVADFCEKKPKLAAQTLMSLAKETSRLETALYKIANAVEDDADKLRAFALETIQAESDVTPDYKPEKVKETMAKDEIEDD